MYSGHPVCVQNAQRALISRRALCPLLSTYLRILCLLHELHTAPQLAEEYRNLETAGYVRRCIEATLAAIRAGDAALRDFNTKSCCEGLGMPRGAGPADPPLPDPFVGVIDDDALRNIAETRECAGCGEKGEKLRRCTQCRSAWYCSGACQKGHWVTHKPACRGSTAVVALAAAVAAAVLPLPGTAAVADADG
eukprot:gene54524-biopygen90643